MLIGSNFIDMISDKTDVLKILPEAAQELCSALFRNSPAGIYITRNGKFIYSNIEFRRITGYSQEELIGKDYQRLINPRYRQKPKQNIATLFGEEEEAGHEFKITTKEGKNRWIAEKITYFKYGGNWLTLGHWLDVTEHHAVERAWHEAERRFQSAFEDLSTGITIISTDGIFLKANKSFYDMIGYDEKELLESRFDEVLHPDERSTYGDLMQLFLSLSKPEEPTQKRLICRDGRSIWVAMSISLIGDSEAEPSYFIVHFQNITEQKRIEQGLKEEDQLYRSLVDLSLEPIMVVDLDFHITHVSQKFLVALAYSGSSDLLGRKLPGIIATEECDKVEPQIREMMKQGVPGTLECTLIKGDGGSLPVQINVSWINSDQGTPMYIICSLKDISERKQAEAVAVEAESRASATLENTPAAMMVSSEDTTVVMVNAAFEKMSGYTREEIEGKKSWVEFVAKEDLSKMKKYYLLRRLDPGSAPDTYTFKLSDSQGNIKEVLANIGAIPGTNKTVTSLIELSGFQLVDKQESERQQQSLRESEEQRILRERMLNSTVEALARIVELRDPYTAGHQENVAHLAAAIAAGMDLPKEQIEIITIAARIHDAGKIYVPVEILGKPAKLNDLEKGIVRAHAAGGRDILESAGFPEAVVKAVLQHHERLDGSGYPDSLKGDDIALEARIIMVADVVEAMSHSRAYRPALDIAAALEEVSAGSGVLYDPAVVDSCLKLFREKSFSFEDSGSGS